MVLHDRQGAPARVVTVPPWFFIMDHWSGKRISCFLDLRALASFSMYTLSAVFLQQRETTQREKKAIQRDLKRGKAEIKESESSSWLLRALSLTI